MPESDPESSSDMWSPLAPAELGRIARRAVAMCVFVVIGATLTSPLWGQADRAPDGSAPSPEVVGTPFDRPAQTSGDIPGRTPTGLWIVLAVLLMASGLISGSETALFSLNKLDVIQAHNKALRVNRVLIKLLDRPNDTLTTVLVLNNLVNVALSLTAGALTEFYFSGPSVGGFAVAAIGATGVLLVFGEVVPKCVAQARAPAFARLTAWPTAFASYVLTPVRAVMNRFIALMFRKLNVEETRITDRVSEEELKAIMTAGEVSTLLEEDEREMIAGVFELGATFAEEIMVPRTEVTVLADTLSQQEMLDELRGASHSRVLIYHGEIDHLDGFVLAKEILLNPERPWREGIREITCVPQRIRLFDLLTRFRRTSTKITALVDEYGQVAGIVTLHDLLEEIVGDIAERHEQVVSDCQKIGPGRWRVRGQMKLSDLGKELSIDFPDDLGNTIGGFIMNTLGKVPSTGAELRFEGLTLKVTRMVGRRVTHVEIHEADSARGDSAASPYTEATP